MENEAAERMTVLISVNPKPTVDLGRKTNRLNKLGGQTLFSAIEKFRMIFPKGMVNSKMCLAIPAKVLEVKGDIAKVDFGEGVAREVNVMLVDAKVGEYVLVHAGYAIEKLDQKAAEESLNTWRQILEQT